MAELSIKSLEAQGIKEENIRYLSAGFGDQLEPNGPATVEAVREAIVNWTLETGEPADDVLIYLVDHGGREVFELAKKSFLSAQELDVWLDELQQELPGQLTVVYDACRSGSFIPILAAAGEQERLIISSSGAEQRAHFASKGDVSFSFHFWTNFFIGGDIYRSFTASKNAITTIFNRKQTAEIEADGNGLPNTKNDNSVAQTFSFGQGIATASDVPVVKAVSDTIFLNGEPEAKLEAFGVSGATEVIRVWGMIETPDQIELPIDEPRTNLAIADFERVPGSDDWLLVLDGLNIKGTYEIQVFAENSEGQFSIPPADGSNKILVVQKAGRAPLVGSDSDQDGVLDRDDAFPLDPRFQRDSDRDFIPDASDPDLDNDGERDTYQGRDIHEVPEGWSTSSYVVQDGDTLYGTFHVEEDIDRYPFFAVAGEQLTFTVNAYADSINGPDLILSIVDQDGVIQSADGQKLTVDNYLGGQDESLAFVLAEAGVYFAEVKQAKLEGDQYVVGAQSEYALFATSDRAIFADQDSAAEIDGLSDRAEGLAWVQSISANGQIGSEVNSLHYLFLPQGTSGYRNPAGKLQSIVGGSCLRDKRHRVRTTPSCGI